MSIKIKIPIFILMMLLGVLMFVYAGVDDSPGGQLIGVVVVILGIVGLVRIIIRWKNNK
ncbi:hypothetical protein HN358_01270 [Candidatus Uhrbacteria bacterium]|jgi:hypothetical protein|nr:hypothetical protein [Candidatus Uhrbacteria bacterium]MBT7717338.1 hypothetical protein [Candidatus Uhrbacteria bacterium]